MAGFSFDPTIVSTDRRHTLGSIGQDGADGRWYIYGQANGASVVGSVCLIEKGAQMTPLDTTNAGTHDGAGLGAAQQAVADDSYGWWLIKGDGICRMTDAVTAGAGLHTTGEAGELDDADSNGNINGIVLNAATTAEGDGDCTLFFPTVQGE